VMDLSDRTPDIGTVRWLLAHVYDNVALSEAPILAELPGLADADPQTRANTIRSILLDCIEFLRPPRRQSFRSPAARSHAVLWLRYVEGMSINQVGEELALSERQTHRELRSAEAKLAEVLGTHLSSLAKTASAQDAHPQEPETEVTARPALVDLAQVLASAAATVAPLANSMGVTLRVDAAGATGKVFTDEGILRQFLIQGLSLAVQSSVIREVSALAASEQGMATLTIHFQSGQRPVSPQMLTALRQLADTVNLSCTIAEKPGGEITITLRLPLGQPRNILVIEDSAAAVELYRRYLEPTGEWHVVGVSEPRLAYDMARSLQPALIVLDLLMPGTDGWTILNLLRAHEATADIPVIVCSVFQDTLLAQALGASAHLRKPVSQAQLLSAVRKWSR